MAVRIIVLVLYFAVLLAIGVYTSKMAKSYSEYNLAARSNNKGGIAGISTQSIFHQRMDAPGHAGAGVYIRLWGDLDSHRLDGRLSVQLAGIGKAAEAGYRDL